MMRPRLKQVLLLVFLLAIATSGWAANTVTMDSQSLNPGETNVEVRIKLVNDLTLRNIGVPLAIRTVEGAAFITELKSAWDDRLVEDPAFPLSAIVFLNTYFAEDGICKDGQPGGFGTISFSDTLPHAIPASPVGILFQRGKLFGGELPPGSDVDGSLRLIFDVTTTQGVFEIDTSCANPANHLLFIEDVTNVGVIPDFTKGVFSVGQPPVARDTAWSTNENTARSVSYLPASDPDGDPLQFSITAGPENGTISGFVAATGAFTYTPDSAYFGLDSLSFEATDGGFISNTAKVRITVIDVNDPPIARDTAIVTDEDTPVDGQLQAYDTDSPTLTYERLTGPTHGSITAFNTATGEFTYLPAPNFNGPDAMTFRANDGTANSNPAVVSITVNPINDPPVARDTTIEVPFGTSVNAQFQAYDVDGPSFTYTKLTGPFNGTFTGFDANTGAFTYTPNFEYFGPDSITFNCDDGFGPGNVGTVSINVSSSNCVCMYWGDPNYDGDINAIDMDILIKVLFENYLPSHSPKCPVGNSDYNCDCFLDALDLSRLIDYLFAGDYDICDPCYANCPAP